MLQQDPKSMHERQPTYRRIILLVGLTTFAWGFATGAVVHTILLWTGSLLVQDFRASLTYPSAVLGDGVVLPLVSMVVASVLLQRRPYNTHTVLVLAALGGGIGTAWFHGGQALSGVVNWVMPRPWHWNVLGLWHAVFMFSVASLLGAFVIVARKVAAAEHRLPGPAPVVSVGVTLFFGPLKLDGTVKNLASLFP